MGLLFKVDGVSSSSPTYTALSVIMLLLCCAFVVSWLLVIGARVVSTWRQRRRGVSVASATVTASVKLLAAASRARGDGGGGGAVFQVVNPLRREVEAKEDEPEDAVACRSTRVSMLSAGAGDDAAEEAGGGGGTGARQGSAVSGAVVSTVAAVEGGDDNRRRRVVMVPRPTARARHRPRVKDQHDDEESPVVKTTEAW
jgi:hypothetical protein